MHGFMWVWVGQVVSLLGTAMTTFGVTIWAFEATGRATDLALIGVFYLVPQLLMSPLAGVLVDRYSRKLMMILSDLMSGLMTIGVLVLFTTGQLEVWHLFVMAGVQGAFQSVQWPATSAAIATMLDKEQYTRANGMMQMADPSSRLITPLLAGALLGALGLQQGLLLILLFDVVTFVIAIGTLLVVYIPAPRQSEDAGRDNPWREISFGFRYILQRPSLLALQMIFFLGNFLYSLAFALLAPMILARTGNNELLFGSVQTIGAVGGLTGAIVVSIWGGFQRRVHGVLLGWAAALAAATIIGLGRYEPAWAGLPIWGLGVFLSASAGALLNSSNQAIWQAKVAPDVQGRVFAIRSFIATAVIPLAGVIVGPLADNVMEPAMQEGGTLTGTFGWLVGSGPGAGMSLIFIFVGLIGAAVVLCGYLVPMIRRVEDILPDHDMVEEAPLPTPAD